MPAAEEFGDSGKIRGVDLFRLYRAGGHHVPLHLDLNAMLIGKLCDDGIFPTEPEGGGGGDGGGGARG